MRDARLQSLDIVGDMAVRGEDVQPAVEIGVEEEAAEGERQERRAAERGAGRLVEEQPALVVEQCHHLVREVADHEAGKARVVVVGGVHAHAGTRHPRLTISDAGDDADVLEAAVPPVAEQLIRLGVVGDEQVHPAVGVGVEHRNTEPLGRRRRHTRRGGYILERPVAPVPVKRAGLAGVRLGRAVRLRRAVERAEEIRLDRPLDVIGDEQIGFAVGIVVPPDRARREPGIADARHCSRVFERAVAPVAVEAVRAEGSDIQIDVPVVVVVGRRPADAVDRLVQARRGGHVGKMCRRRRCGRRRTA